MARSNHVYHVPMERYVSYFLREAIFPTPQRPRVLIPFPPRTHIYVTEPHHSPLPISGASYIQLLRSLGPDNCVKLLLLTQTEQKILLHSLRPALLTHVSEAVTSMIFPLKWQCPYVPLCPLSLCDVIDAPMPFIVGIDTRYFDKEDKPNDVIFVDLDTNDIFIPPDKALSAKMMPRKATKALHKTLTKIMKDLIVRIPHDISVLSNGTESTVVKRQFELLLQEAFLRFHATIFKGYGNFLRPILSAPTLGTTDASKLFDINGFLRSRDRLTRGYYSLLMKTQMFYRFIEDRSLASRQNSDLAFFDECCIKVETNSASKLIETEVVESDLTAIVIAPEDQDRIFEYARFPETLDHGLFPVSEPVLKPIRSVSDQSRNHVTGSPVALRSKHEVKMGIQEAKKVSTNPKYWSQLLLSYSYSLWFLMLPSFVAMDTSFAQDVLSYAYKVIKYMQELRLRHNDEIAYRVVMQLCGQFHEPYVALRLLVAMKRAGITPNAITYGHYNKAVLECKWPSERAEDPKGIARRRWAKIRCVFWAVAQFKYNMRKKRGISMASLVPTEDSTTDAPTQSPVTIVKSPVLSGKRDSCDVSAAVLDPRRRHSSASEALKRFEPRRLVSPVVHSTPASPDYGKDSSLMENSEWHPLQPDVGPTGIKTSSSDGVITERLKPQLEELDVHGRSAVDMFNKEPSETADGVKEEEVKRKREERSMSIPSKFPPASPSETHKQFAQLLTEQPGGTEDSVIADGDDSLSGFAIPSFGALRDSMRRTPSYTKASNYATAMASKLSTYKRRISEASSSLIDSLDQQSKEYVELHKASNTSIPAYCRSESTSTTTDDLDGSSLSHHNLVEGLPAGPEGLLRGSQASLSSWGRTSETPTHGPKDKQTPYSLEVLMSTCQRCSKCHCLIYDEVIQAYWSPNDSNLNIPCPYCNQSIVPMLHVYIRDMREQDVVGGVPIGTVGSMASLLSAKGGSSIGGSTRSMVGSAGNLQAGSGLHPQTQLVQCVPSKPSLENSRTQLMGGDSFSETGKISDSNGCPSKDIASHEGRGFPTSAIPSEDSTPGVPLLIDGVDDMVPSDKSNVARSSEVPLNDTLPPAEQLPVETTSCVDKTPTVEKTQAIDETEAVQETEAVETAPSINTAPQNEHQQAPLQNTQTPQTQENKKAQTLTRDDSSSQIPANNHDLTETPSVDTTLIQDIVPLESVATGKVAAADAEPQIHIDITDNGTESRSDVATTQPDSQIPTNPAPENPSRQDSGTSSSSQTDANLVSQTNPDSTEVEPPPVPYLSPIVLRKELENILRNEPTNALITADFIDDHPIIYWNLMWYFKRMKLTSHLPSLLLISSLLNSEADRQENAPSRWGKHRVSVRLLWDNIRLQDDFVYKPMYERWIEHRGTSSRKQQVLDEMIDYIYKDDLYTPLESLLSELSQRRPPRRRSVYRELLFLTCAALRVDAVNLFAFDTEYGDALQQLDEELLDWSEPQDEPPSLRVAWCRTTFGALEL